MAPRSVIFVDTNVVLDIFDRDPKWFAWSSRQLAEAVRFEQPRINIMIISELSRSFAALADLQRLLDAMDLATEPLDAEAAFLAGKHFQQYRRMRSEREPTRVLPDFWIGAHASLLHATLLTRDATIYRRYFPDLSLITPETHPHG